MPVTLQVTQIIDKPIAKVFHFYAHDHVQNHPRWDPDIELSLDSDEPIQVGTIIQRRNSRSGTPVEGTMEVVEYELDQSFGVIIHDGPIEMRGRALFDAVNDHQTKITTTVELPSMDENMDTGFLTRRMERSSQRMKQLMETEL